MNPLGLEWFESKAKNLCGNLSINDQFVGLASLLLLGYFRDVAKGGAEGEPQVLPFDEWKIFDHSRKMIRRQRRSKDDV